MRWTSKLLRNLAAYFDRTPHPFLALRLSYAGGMTWTVAEGRLTTAVTGGTGAALDIDLSGYTLAGLAAYLNTRPGYQATLMAGERASLSALVLLEDSQDIAASNGDHLTGYTSYIWSWCEGWSRELSTLRTQADNAVAQVSLATAEGDWPDLHGTYYARPRKAGEADRAYCARIARETLRPLCNNIAIAEVIRDRTGLRATVEDVTTFAAPVPNYGGSYLHDSSEFHNAAPKPIYGRFDVTAPYSASKEPDAAVLRAELLELIARATAAGTELRTLTLVAS
ncbi:MAG: hypothetical protein E7K72_18260 [Roseomonas mucosa]|nr:hypothetical protein [Roseomonas mucosa]